MFVLSVELEIAEQNRDDFAAAISRQARTSVASEPGCLRFDVAVSRDDPNIFLLYEIYSDEDAFEEHKKMDHSVASGELTKPWIKRAEIRSWNGVASAG